MLLKIGSETLYNICSNIKDNNLTYLIESKDWSIKWDGKYVTGNLNSQKLLKSRIAQFPFGIRNQIIHFGSENLIPYRYLNFISNTNSLVCSVFHIDPDNRNIHELLKIQKRFEYFHCSSSITVKAMIDLGFDKIKIIRIPLGVDTKIFKEASLREKMRLRKKFNLPQERIIIGSFQKDGQGWDDGNIAKLIKGPDIFVETIKLLKNINPFLLLSGPARGYIKKLLDESGIEYRHIFLDDYEKISELYQVLDLYLISSRVEGGPKSLLESLAVGIPVVSTPVGMAPDVTNLFKNLRIGDFNSKTLASLCLEVVKFNKNKYSYDKNIQKFDWAVISKLYYTKIYSNLI
jgi:glycosyltransferase involved in cell wall biosynthesis